MRPFIRGYQSVVLTHVFGLSLLIANVTAVRAEQPAERITTEQQQQLDEAAKLNTQVVKLHREGKAKAATALAKQALEIRRKVLGDEHPDTATSLNNVGALLEAQGEYLRARPYYEQALKINQKALGDEHPDTAMMLNNLGHLFAIQGDNAGARQYYEKAIKINTKVLGEEHPDTATSLNNLGSLLMDQGDYPEARRYYEQALKIRKKVLGEDHSDTAGSLNNLGSLLKEQSDYAGARPYYEQSLKIYKKILGDEHPHTATLLNNLGALLKAQGDYVGARPYYERSLKIYKKILGDEHPNTATLLNNLGLLLQTQGDYAAARSYYEQALKITKKNVGDEHPDTATLLSNLGLLYSAQGDYAAARSNYEQSLKIRKKVLGDEHIDTALSLNNLGALHQDQGDFAVARSYYEQSFKIYKKILGDEHPDTALSLNNLGALFQDQEDYKGARTYYEQSLNIKKKVLGDEHPDTALALNNLGVLLKQQGDYGAARPYYEQSLKIRKKVFGDEHPNTALSLNNLGLLLQAQGDDTAARSYYEQALKIRKKVLGDEHPDTAISMHSLLILEMAGGNGDAAVKLMEQSRRGARRHIARILPALSEKEQRLFLEGNDKNQFHGALSLGHLLRQDPFITTLSAGWLLNGKGVGHAALAEKTLLTRDLTNPDLAADVQQMLDTRQKLARLVMSVPKPGQETARRAELDKLTADENRLGRELTEKSGRTVETDPWVELPRVRKALPTDSVLIDIARFEIFNYQSKGKEKKFDSARYVAWIIPPTDQGDVQIFDLGAADIIEAAVEVARETIQTAAQENGLLKRQGEEAAEKQARQSLQKLADLVWMPLAEKLAGAKQIILSPDGALWLVPWGALPITSDKVLLETYPLRYVVSGRDIVKSNTTKLTGSQPAVFADPNFDLSAEETRQSIQAVFPKKKLDEPDQTRGVTSKTALPRVSRLPNTATEAQAIAPNIERFAKARPQAYTDRYALESVFKTVQRPSMLVLSTHGFFLPDQETKNDDDNLASTDTRASILTVDGKQIENPLLRCGVLLAGCNAQQSTAGDDGVLTGMEIVGVDLRGTKLVVLSACETGIGKIRNGEGVAGLRQAFQLAGAKSVVATLWQVPDRDSMLIMNDFFQNLADGQSKTDALRSAQLKRIHARRDKNSAAHPFFWAAWTLTGE